MHGLFSGDLYMVGAIMFLSSFFISYGLDFVLGQHGFGIFGSMAIINIQFPIGYWFSKTYFDLHSTTNEQLLFAISFAAITMICLAIFKAAWLKL